MSSRTGGIVPTVVAEPPLPTAVGGGGGDVHGGSGGPHVGPVDEEDKLIAQASGQHVVCNTDPGKAPAILITPLGDTLVNKPKMYSTQKIDLDGIPMEEVVCLEPLTVSVADAPLDSRPMAGNTYRNPSDYVVHKEDQTSRPTEGVTSPAPSRHSVMQLHLDSQSSKYRLQPDQSGYPVLDGIPRRQVGFSGNQTVPDFLVDINGNGGGNPVPKLAPLELAEHSTSVEHSLRSGYLMPDDTPSRRVCFYDSQTVSNLLVESMADGDSNPVPTAPSELAEHSTSVEDSLRPSQPVTSEHLTDIRRGVVGASDNQPVLEPTEQSRSGDNLSVHAGPLILKWRSKERSLPELASELRQSEGPARIDRPEYTGSRPESGEAIVVGAIGSAASWFLTGWAHDVEIEFMIDTGCQVTILSTTVFQRESDGALRFATLPPPAGMGGFLAPDGARPRPVGVRHCVSRTML